MSRNYPSKGSPAFTTTSSRPGCTHCDVCKKGFAKNETFAIVETQVSWFRGDDEVELFCKECGTAKGIVFPQPKMEKPPHQCPDCGKTCKGEEGLAAHRWAKHRHLFPERTSP